MDIHRCRFVDYTPHTITTLLFSHHSISKFTPLDLRLAVGRANGDIEIWNPRYDWVHEQTLKGAQGRSVEGVVWSTRDGELPRLFSIGGSTMITEWNLQNGTPLVNYDCNAGVIWSMLINDRGDKLCVGCDDGSVVVVDISGGAGSLEHEMILQRQDSRVLSITWVNDELIIGGCADGRVRVWGYLELQRGRIVSTLRVDKSKTESTLVWSVLALPKRQQLVTGDSTGSVKFWNLQHFVLQQTFKVHQVDVLCLTTDYTQEKIFSGGIDRKIFNFNLINEGKWVNSSNRLLHSNDVRLLLTFESKGSNFLVSGGVERSIVINSVNNFHDGPYRKLPIVLQNPNVLVNATRKFVVMWQDQLVKIWKINEFDKSKKLIAKLVLSDDENITCCTMDKKGKFLFVGRLVNIKCFAIQELGGLNYKVHKLKLPILENHNATHLKITDDKLIAVTSQNEIISFPYTIDTDSLQISKCIEYELPEPIQIKSLQPHMQNINDFKISNDGTMLAVSRLSGTVDLIDLNDTKGSYRLIKLNKIPIKIDFTKTGSLVLITCENKFYEFNTNKKRISKQDITTPWCKRNTEILPISFLKLNNKCQGFFKDNSKDNRIWLYGDNWVCFFDLNQNLPQQQQLPFKNKKRRRNSSVVMTISETTNTVDDSLNNEFLDELEMDIVLEDNFKNLKEFEINRILPDDTQDDENCYWFTQNYKSIMFCDSFGYNEIIVIERPVFLLPTTPAFKLNKIII